jgi:hypothetical protein
LAEVYVYSESGAVGFFSYHGYFKRLTKDVPEVVKDKLTRMSPATLMHKRLFNFRRERFTPIEYPLGINSSEEGRKMQAHIDKLERDGTYDKIEKELFKSLDEKKKYISDFARTTD